MLINLISTVYAQIEVPADAFKNAFLNFKVPEKTFLFGVDVYDGKNSKNTEYVGFSFNYSDKTFLLRFEESDKVRLWMKMNPKKLKKIFKEEENIFVGKDFVLPMAKYFVSGLLSNDKRIISNEVSEEFLTIFYKLFLQPNKSNKKNKDFSEFYTVSLPSIEKSKKILKELKEKCNEHSLEFFQVFDTLFASVSGFVSVSFEAHESIDFEEKLRNYIVEVGKFSPAENAINGNTTAPRNKLYSVQFTHLFDGITKYDVSKEGIVRVVKKYLDLEIFDTMLKKSIKESIEKNLDKEQSKTLTQLSYKIINKDEFNLTSKMFYEILVNKKERDKVLKINTLFLGLKSLANEFAIRSKSETIKSVITVSNNVTEENNKK
jgi:hypothetical protein